MESGKVRMLCVYWYVMCVLVCYVCIGMLCVYWYVMCVLVCYVCIGMLCVCYVCIGIASCGEQYTAFPLFSLHAAFCSSVLSCVGHPWL